MSFGGGAGGGAGSIQTSTDVFLSSPSNGQVLSYNTGTLKWVNTTNPTAPVSSVAGKTGAVTLVKGDVGLGNVDNTSDANKPISSAVQTALEAKPNETTTITGTISVSGGGDLTANRTLSLVNDSATPGNSRYYGTNSSGTKGWYTLPSGGGSTTPWEGVLLDDFAGATDDEKLTAALAYQSSTAGRPAILMSPRLYTFNQTRNLYSGLKLIGAPAGPRNMELAGSTYVPTRIDLGNSITSGTGSWWVPPSAGGDVYDVYMADFAMQGNTGSSQHQFLDYPPTTGSMYACQFHALSFDFMRSIFGRKDRVCAFTQVLLTGHWTANNLWDTQFHLGGSDNSLWMGGMINMGPSQSGAQTGTYADSDYEFMFNNMSKTNVGYIYMTALNGWRGIRVQGSSSFLTFYGGVFEGYNANTPAPGTVIKLEGGVGSFYGPNIGQGMGNPDAAEGGLVQVSGGEWNFYGPIFYRGNMADTTPCIYQTGGRVHVSGATRRQSETWSARPVLSSGVANAAGAGTYTTYVPDLSMNVT